MIEYFKDLTEEEKEILLKAPVLVSVFAASINHHISNAAKTDAIRLAHLKTFTAVPLLRPYYKEVEKNFRNYFESTTKQFAPFDQGKIELLKNELNKINIVISKLDNEFGQTLRASLTKYADHVKKSEHLFVESFFFPFLINGFTKNY